MFKEMRKRAAKNMIIPLCVCIAVAVVIMAMGGKDVLITLKGYTDITNASVKEIKNTKKAEIKVDKYNLYGCFSEEYETNNGKDEVKAYYYLVLVGDESDKRFMAVKVKAKNYARLLTIEDEYTDLDNGVESDAHTVLKIKGDVVPMESDAYTHFKSMMASYDYTDEDIPFVTLNLMVKDNSMGYVVFVFPTVALLFILVPLLMLISTLCGGKTKKLEKELNAKGTGYIEKVEYEYMNSEKFGNNLKISKNFTFAVKGLKNLIIPNEDIVWAYFIKTTHRTNGIKTGTSYEIMLACNNRKFHRISVGDENMAVSILNMYRNLTDTIVLGYEDNLKKLYYKNYDEFLNIAYRNHVYGEKADNDQY